MSREELEAFTQETMEIALQPTRDLDPMELLEDGLKKYDFAMEVPVHMRPDSAQGDEEYYAIRAQDYTEETPRFDVSKQFTDINGGDLEPGDLVDVTISLIPVGGAIGPIAYRDQLRGPWLLYKDERGKIVDFDYGNLPEDVGIDRNISNGYQFMIYDLALNGAKTF
mgnify:CR=1 FL=1